MKEKFTTINIKVPEHVHKRLKIYAIEKNINQSEALEMAINSLPLNHYK